jgi:hypothetical protein
MREIPYLKNCNTYSYVYCEFSFLYNIIQPHFPSDKSATLEHK